MDSVWRTSLLLTNPHLRVLLLRPAGGLLLGPLPLAHSHHLGSSRQLVGRKESARVLEVCGPNWRVCEADYSCRESGPGTAWIPWLISFSGREAVKQRVSCCSGKSEELGFSGDSDWFVQAWMLWPVWLFDRGEEKVWRHCDDEKRRWLRIQHGGKFYWEWWDFLFSNALITQSYWQTFTLENCQAQPQSALPAGNDWWILMIIFLRRIKVRLHCIHLYKSIRFSNFGVECLLMRMFHFVFDLFCVLLIEALPWWETLTYFG